MLVTYLANTIIGVYAQHVCLDDILGLCYACFDDDLIQTPMVQYEKLQFAACSINTAI